MILPTLLAKCDGLDAMACRSRHPRPNTTPAVAHDTVAFDPTIKDGKVRPIRRGLPKSNWAQTLGDKGPLSRVPGHGWHHLHLRRPEGLRERGQVSGYGRRSQLSRGCYLPAAKSSAASFLNGYPGGSGLTSGAVFGRIAGTSSVESMDKRIG